jgi:hypothetical protein
MTRETGRCQATQASVNGRTAALDSIFRQDAHDRDGTRTHDYAYFSKFLV